MDFSYNYYVELVEPADKRACIRCCDNYNDCPLWLGKESFVSLKWNAEVDGFIDTSGCPAVIPGNYFNCSWFLSDTSIVSNNGQKERTNITTLEYKYICSSCSLQQGNDYNWRSSDVDALLSLYTDYSVIFTNARSKRGFEERNGNQEIIGEISTLESANKVSGLRAFNRARPLETNTLRF